jgi:hypothetical protein
MFYIVEETAGRSAVNMERLVSTAVVPIGRAALGLDGFDHVLELLLRRFVVGFGHEEREC